jgi:hypothetical protein
MARISAATTERATPSVVTLARKQSGEAFDVRPQWANLQVAQFFGFRIKMNHHSVVPFMG